MYPTIYIPIKPQLEIFVVMCGYASINRICDLGILLCFRYEGKYCRYNRRKITQSKLNKVDLVIGESFTS